MRRGDLSKIKNRRGKKPKVSVGRTDQERDKDLFDSGSIVKRLRFGPDPKNDWGLGGVVGPTEGWSGLPP